MKYNKTTDWSPTITNIFIYFILCNSVLILLILLPSSLLSIINLCKKIKKANRKSTKRPKVDRVYKANISTLNVNEEVKSTSNQVINATNNRKVGFLLKLY